MKKFFTQQVNFAYAMIIVLTMIVGVVNAQGSFSESSGYGLPGQSIPPLLHQGGGEQPITKLRLGQCAAGNPGCNPTGASFDTRGPAGAVSRFDAATGAFFSALYDAVFFQKLYVSLDAASSINFWKAPHGPNNIVSTTQSVNVDGNVLATNLVNTGGGRNVCVTPEGDIVLCPDLTYGSCGMAAGHTYSSPPSNNLCSGGTASAVTTNPTTYTWSCNGTGGSASCQANRVVPVNGDCGPAQGHTYSSPPTSGLCLAGNATSVQTNPTTYTWNCNGTGGGSNDSCQANRTIAVNGQCRNYGGNYTSQPATGTGNGCIRGTYSDIADSGTQFKWSCLGSGGGTTDTPCTANIAPPATPACVPYGGVYTSQPATNSATGCQVGTYSDLTDTASEWRWRCTEGGTNLTCSANKQAYNGYWFVCGSDPQGVPSPTTGQRPGNWTRTAQYDQVNTGNESPFSMGVQDCNDAVSPPTNIINPAATGTTTTNPTNGDTLYYQFLCLTAAPSGCYCKVDGYTEQQC